MAENILMIPKTFGKILCELTKVELSEGVCHISDTAFPNYKTFLRKHPEAECPAICSLSQTELHLGSVAGQ